MAKIQISKRVFRIFNIRISNLFRASRFGFRIWRVPRAGFTIIEMLVVVAIAGMLLSGTLVLQQQSRAKARDATREQHVKTIQNALALYVTNFGLYPVYDGNLTGSDAVSTILVQTDALPQMPRDPLSSGTYLYSYTSADGTTYTLKYYLETGSIPGKAAGLNQSSP